MKNYQVIWNGPVLKSTGIGTASREYALALHRQGVDVKVATNRSRPLLYTRNKLGVLSSLVKKPIAPKKTHILIYHGLPNTLDLKKARKQYRYIVLNTVWETTRIPTNWRPYMNRYDAVIVPSVQNKTAMKASGVKVPVFIVPHGVNTQAFTPSNRKLPLSLKKGTFVFVSVFTFQHRKNPETLLRAYWEEFSPKDRVALVIKTNGIGSKESGSSIHRRIHAYKKKCRCGHTAPLHLITGHTSPQKLKALYATGNAFVLPTRGEGVGLPFLEALSSGLPVIATRWGGQMDFLNAKNSLLIDYKLQPPVLSMKKSISRNFRNLFAQRGQLWAEPNLKHLKKQMRFAYQHPAICRQKGKQGRSDMRNHSWNRAGIAMKQAVAAVIRAKKSR
ncbi:Glycosyl transferases group 1 [Paenibacillus sp. 1_12]|uniref:glycosyltransferase n=1 Tax=Paenibacillus sp. 1_12 TaxID=1566278 RepID=UPI0008E2AB9D|nr:glycosyltransferase [Paenibacillus sp. 1_12]SFL54292.1 Glycosyl transferases group 1 [Paenibacillus sp. 1_12]